MSYRPFLVPEMICLCAMILAAPGNAAQEVVLHSFAPFPHGENPIAGLIRDQAGNLYGTAPSGGLGSGGVVYKLDPAGKQTVLYSFTGGLDGGSPQSALTADAAGNLYGTAYSGGTAGLGVAYRLDTSGRETVLHNFSGTDGANPVGGVIFDDLGNLYGTTYYGGPANAGVVYELTASGQESVLYAFLGLADGAHPNAGVIRDQAGNLFGTTVYGGKSTVSNGIGGGVIYKIDPAETETVLYSFSGGPDGGKQPYAGVITDEAGNLYGTTGFGGTYDAGVFYKLDTMNNWTLVYSFFGGGGEVNGGVVRGSNGNFFGTTNVGPLGPGQIYKVDADGTGSIIHIFNGANGASPLSGLILDPEGNLYGTTSDGGEGNAGVVYKLDSAARETVLYSFPAGTDGANPDAGLVSDRAGNFYGTTYYGGSNGRGAVYKINAAGKESLIYSFQGGSDGSNPYANLILDSSGNLYGTTLSGGNEYYGYGSAFKIDPSGVETVLYGFTGGESPANPYGSLTLDAAGNLYGTARNDGFGYGGAVFEISASGQYSTVYSFPSTVNDAENPEAGVIVDAHGNLYGTAVNGGAMGLGAVFKITPTGQEGVVHSFAGGSDGANPYSKLAADAAGNLYGTTLNGGISNAGVVFRIDSSGQETVLYSFTGGADGGMPYAGVIRDAKGNLYGTTFSGGALNAGVVYRIDAAGQESVLYSFTSGADGGNPQAGLIFGAGGNLLGTTYNGGKHGSGAVFEIKAGME